MLQNVGAKGLRLNVFFSVKSFKAYVKPCYLNTNIIQQKKMFILQGLRTENGLVRWIYF